MLLLTKLPNSYVFGLYFRLLNRVIHFLIFIIRSLRKTSDTLDYGKNNPQNTLYNKKFFFHAIMLLNKVVENKVILPFPLH